MELTGLNELLSSGVTGVVLTVSLSFNLILFKALMEVQNLRVADAQKMEDKISGPLKLIQQTVDLILALLKGQKDV